MVSSPVYEFGPLKTVINTSSKIRPSLLTILPKWAVWLGWFSSLLPLKILSATRVAIGPESRITPMAPTPGGVANATIVEDRSGRFIRVAWIKVDGRGKYLIFFPVKIPVILWNKL